MYFLLCGSVQGQEKMEVQDLESPNITWTVNNLYIVMDSDVRPNTQAELNQQLS